MYDHVDGSGIFVNGKVDYKEKSVNSSSIWHSPFWTWVVVYLWFVPMCQKYGLGHLKVTLQSLLTILKWVSANS